jgi:hypothetical protein
MSSRANDRLVSRMNYPMKLVQALVLGFLYMAPVVASPEAGLCIEARDKLESPPKAPNRPILLQQKFSYRGKLYRLINERVGDGLDIQDSSGKVISATGGRQWGGGEIEDFTIFDKGWIWIRGTSTDYISAIDDKDGLPVLRPARLLSELRAGHCSAYMFGDEDACLYVQGSFSPSLNRVFISGYKHSGWSLFADKTLYQYQLYRGRLLPWPAEMAGATFVQDLPGLLAAEFKGANGDLLIYDGNKVHTIEYFIDKKKVAKQTLNTVNGSDRVFLTNIDIYPIERPFLAELKPDFSLHEIRLPDSELGNTFVQYYDLSHQSRLVLLGVHSIYYEDHGVIRKFAETKSSYFLISGLETWQKPDGSLFLVYKNGQDNSKLYFSLSIKNCQNKSVENSAIQILNN